jgi:RimJ/RimL family protein N-acetyltransferase
MPESLTLGGQPWKPGLPLVLETERFVLRSLSAGDATPTYVGWWNDPEIQEPLGFRPRDWTRGDAVRHIQRFDNRKNFHLGIFPRGQDLPIGFFAMFVEGEHRAMTNVVIGDKGFWGLRVPSEVRARCLDFLFGEIGVIRVYGAVSARNFASIYNYKAQGFSVDGVLRKHGLDAAGHPEDQIVFSMLAEEWAARKRESAPVGGAET